MKILSLFVVAALAVSAAFGRQAAVKQVTITGNMIHKTPSTPEVLRIHFLNPFQKHSPSVKTDAAGAFIASGEMLFTQNMTVQYNNTFINLYVAPGDSVHLTIDAALLNSPDFAWLTITGDHARISTELNKCHYFLSQLPYKKYDYSVSVPNMRAAIQADYDRYLAALTTYAERHQTDPVVVAFSKRDIIYGISNWMNDYVKLGSPETSTMAERIALFNDPLFEVHDAANFQSMMFPYHLSAYSLWVTHGDSTVLNAVKQERWKDAVHGGVALLLKEPAGISRDYLVFSFLQGLAAINPALLDEMPEISRYFTQPLTYEYLKKEISLAGEVSFPSAVLKGVSYLAPGGVTKALPGTDVFKHLAKRHPGKVIFVDVYATWCGPCLAEMKFAPALHKEFSNKGVVFVNLCLQSGLEDWKKLVKTERLDGENYFLDTDASKLFMGNYRLSGYPSYLLLNKQGKIVTAQAPRPSEVRVLNRTIAQLLK
ncbi:TlpA family protein disulfide reductase [Hufsiella ginkgonis]|uniref:Redoxin family protein n=1 Tax=Hufsiella ginkgonis TaxID=2695274 RepID=A0A7K1XVF5_9SPHI|nr:TlpA disulfide reductase family protein [Hufsiella ginkgonis]MXV14496.1 redoxin family protein [Hufsiella ginkgonis]